MKIFLKTEYYIKTFYNDTYSLITKKNLNVIYLEKHVYSFKNLQRFLKTNSL